jgi:hypothetical protein
MAVLSEEALQSILSAGRHMGRDRYQEGSLVLVGKRVKKWRGHCRAGIPAEEPGAKARCSEIGQEVR